MYFNMTEYDLLCFMAIGYDVNVVDMMKRNMLQYGMTYHNTVHCKIEMIR